MLRNYIDPTHDDWDEHLTAAEFDINNAYQESIKTTPFMLNYGQNPLTPTSLRIPRIQNPKVLTVIYKAVKPQFGTKGFTDLTVVSALVVKLVAFVPRGHEFESLYGT